MAERTENDGDRATDEFFDANRGAPQSREKKGESLDQILRDGDGGDREDRSIANIHTGSKDDHEATLMAAPPEGAAAPDDPSVAPDVFTPGEAPPPIEPIEVEQQADGAFVPEERPLDFAFRDAEAREDVAVEEVARVDDEVTVRRDDAVRPDANEELILPPETAPPPPETPTAVDDAPEAPVAADSVLGEDALDGDDGARAITQPLIIDFGADGGGDVRFDIPDSLRDMNIGQGGTPLTLSLSEDGAQIRAVDGHGDPVFTVTLSETDGEYSYTFALQGAVDHGDLDQIDLPIGIAVTDADGDVARGEFNVGIVDDAPVAHDDDTRTLREGGGTVGSDDGGDNLLANDDLGADGALIFQFTYTDETGQEQTARAGETVDTENGTLTVNADGSWSFEADANADHSGGTPLVDAFTYSIVDADGDTSSASQTITITDSGPRIGFPDDDGDRDGRGDTLTLDEADVGAAGATLTQALDIDFGADGVGSVALSVPAELEEMNLTADGEAVTFTLADDGRSIVATAGGSPVFTLGLSEEDGRFSYTFELQGNLDHPEGGDLLSDLPFALTVTDGDGSTASAEIKINVRDDTPTAVDDRSVTLAEGGGTVGSGDGGANLLANDDLGADGAAITSFTYTDEAGREQTAEAGSTVDTKNGTLTVNADGSWSFEADANADHSGDAVVADGFTYTITDGDGDTATASQAIEITDDGPRIDLPGGDGPGVGGYGLTLDEGDLGSDAEAGSQALDIDFGADGVGSVALSVPAELEEMNLTADGEAVTFTVADDGRTVTGATPDGSPVLTISLSDTDGRYSYNVELSGNLDHAGEAGDAISDIPVTLTVTDGDGDRVSTTLSVNVLDDGPDARGDGDFNVTDGGKSIGTSDGADNLLANDDVGADGAAITSFTYTDEDGERRTATAGDTVDTEQGTLTVNADGTWSFQSDARIESADGGPVVDGFSYTITDGDGDTATADVGINVSDGTVERPDVVVADAEGYEDKAIPLEIDAGLGDTDGSETLAITISGVPEGAALSAGTDNGDGTWSLQEADLDGLTVTPPTDSDADFDLSVSVTATETATGETSTVETSFTVEVDAVADPTTVNASVETRVIAPEPGPKTEGGVIDVDNFGDTDSGFRVVGRDIDGEVDADNVITSGGSLGVGGAAVGNVVPNQIGHNPETGEAEGLIVEFDNDVSEVSFEVSRLFQNEGDSRGDAAGDEQGKVILYRDGAVVGEIEFTAESRHEGGFTVRADDGGPFDAIEFTATEYSEGDGTQTGDSSDYFVDQISFTHADPPGGGEPRAEVTVNVDATFGDYGDGSEEHFVFVEVPDGWEVQGQGMELVDNGDYPQLPADGTFVKVAVTAEQLDAGEGAVSVPVTFIAPASEAGEDVRIDVFSAAFETNLDGTELTTDNNVRFAGTSVEVDGTDLTVSNPDMDLDDASGLEDTAIPLNLDIQLGDTDGSETMSITLSGVPEGATLSAGTDNGDGTYTLDAGDLEGLSITPPADSDVDFDLGVAVSVTEAATGETKVYNEDVRVEVVADADAPELDATLSVVPDEESSGDAQGDGSAREKGNRGHGNNVDGVDDDNPGRGGGGPNAFKEGDGIDEDEGERGGDGGAGAWRGRSGSGHGRGGSGSGRGGSGAGSGARGGSGARAGNDDDGATTYDLDIESALTDVDGSESLTISIGPVPQGVTFSAGTDNGDGTWSLTPDDLQDLQMTVAAEVEADFDVPITATSTEAENGDSATVDMNLRVELPEDHGLPAPEPETDRESGHGSGSGSGQGKSGSGHGRGSASGRGRGGSDSGSGHGSGSGQGRSGSGHGRGSASGRGRGDSDSGSGHSRGSGQGRGGSGSGHGAGMGSAAERGSGHGIGSGQGIAAAGASGQGAGRDDDDGGRGGPQGNNGFGNGDQDAPGGSLENNNAENAQGDDALAGGGGDDLMNALDKFANAEPNTDGGRGRNFMDAGNGNNGDDGGNWFDEPDRGGNVDDDVFGKTEMEQKEEEDVQAEQAAQEEEPQIQIPVEDNGGTEADFEDRSLV